MTGDEPTLAQSLAGVDGWLHLDEAEMLHQAVLDVPLPAALPVTVVEIGTLFGRSAIALALAVKSRPGGGRVFAVDPHELGSEREFRRNVSDRGLEEIIEPVLLRSNSARGIVADGSVHVLFIDGGHEYADVSQDITDWTPALADVATVAFNDTHFPGVYRAVLERVVTEPFRWSRPHLVRSTLFLQYHRDGSAEGADHRGLQRVRIVLGLRRAAGAVKSVLPKPVRQAGNWVTRRLVG
jgi:predicted O-methyltransferase YrrM